MGSFVSHGFLPSLWETQVEFLVLGFDLTQPWLLQAYENSLPFMQMTKNLKKQSFRQPQRNNGNGCTTIYLAPVTQKEIYGPYAQGLRNREKAHTLW